MDVNICRNKLVDLGDGGDGQLPRVPGTPHHTFVFLTDRWNMNPPSLTDRVMGDLPEWMRRWRILNSNDI